MEMEQINEIKETLIPLLIDYGLDVLGALVIVIAGWIISRWASKRVNRFADRSGKIDDTLRPILVKGVKITIITLVFLIVLGQFGVETASILALLGTIGLAIGLALQGTLSNIASGMMLLVLRPFNVGDVVDIGGTLGVVDEVGLFVTEMHTLDNIAIVMPNSRIWGDKIENYTQNKTRRLDLDFGIGYEDDMDRAMAVIKEVLDKEDRILAEPEPLIAVAALGDSSVTIRVRPWTQTEDLWPLRYDLLKRIKERFDEEGISFPYPQRDLHVYQQNQENG